jgi:hypothetical protein
MSEYIITFKRTEYAEGVVEAKNKKEAMLKAKDWNMVGDFDQFDTNDEQKYEPMRVRKAKGGL